MIEQAIFTSLPRAGRSGYHLVSRSPGIDDNDAHALAAWCPSHGALLAGASNPFSLNFHPIREGRFALSRTCEGPPEYSGRGGAQVYTHALILGPEELEAADWQPFALLRDAMARGLLRFRRDPPASLPAARLGRAFRPRSSIDRSRLASACPADTLEAWCEALMAGRSVKVRYEGDRATLFEALFGILPATLLPAISFTTALRPSAVRPFRIGPAEPAP
ncbi:MAG: hypothetical protein U0800_01985 [Isosphaeraceae bacterium]